MDSRQINIDSRLYGVTTYEEFDAHPDLYNNYFTAVQSNMADGRDLVLPVRSPLDGNKPGLYREGPIFRWVTPPEDNIQYDASNIVDLNNSKTMDELLDKQTQIRDIEREILTSPDSITVPNISSLDTPLMRALKEAVKAKNIDINKYEERFGSNFANDKRSLRQNSVTAKMFVRMAKNLDMAAKVIIYDKSPDVPNPIGHTIEVDLIDGENSEDGEE